MSKTRKWYARALYLVFALALVVGLAVVPVAAVSEAPVAEAPVAPASPDVSSVWVQLEPDDQVAYAAGGINSYHIYFTPGVDLTAGVDKITVIFPTDSTSASTLLTGVDTAAESGEIKVDRDGDAVKYTATNIATAATAAGQILVLTTPVAITAGTEACLVIDDVINPVHDPAIPTDYTLQVYTIQETTHVTSSAYTIGVTAVTLVNFTSTVTARRCAGIAGNYTAVFTTSSAGALVQDVDTITITFPKGTTIPSSITTPAFVEVAGTEATTVIKSGDSVIIYAPAAVNASTSVTVTFRYEAGIKNPTLANLYPDGTYRYTGDGRYIGFVKTSRDLGLARDELTATPGYDVTHYKAAGLAFSSTSASVVGTSQKSGNIYLRVVDKYGNYAYDTTTNAEAVVSSDSSTGKFWYASGYSTSPTVTFGAAEYSNDFKYWDSTEGTPTITASGTGGTAGDADNPYWSDTETWGMTVEAAHVVSLYDASDNLVGTYTTIKGAVDDAQAYFTVKVGPGTYKEAATVPIDQDYVTVESTDGAATTIVDGVDLTTDGFKITGDHVAVKGLTFKDSKTTTHVLDLLDVGATSDYATIQDCVFDLTTGYADATDKGINFSHADGDYATISGCTFNVEESVTGITFGAVVTSLAIKNCTFNGSGTSYNTGYGYVDGQGATATFTSCTFDGTRMAIDLNTAGTVTVKGCTFKNGTKSSEGAIDVAVDMTGLTIYGSTFEDNAGYSIYGRATTITAGNFVVRFNNFINNAKGMKSSDTTASHTYADHNWWGDASGPTIATNAGGTGDALSNAAWDPFLGASISAADYGTSKTSLDASSTVGVKVTSSDSATIGVASHTSNPQETPSTFTPLEDGFFDVYLTEVTWSAGDMVTIKLYSTEVTSTSKAYFYSESYGGWAQCSDQIATSGSNVWVRVLFYDADHPEAQPVLGDMDGLPFAIGTPGVAPPEDIEEQLADIEDELQMVYYFDNATKAWSWYWPGVGGDLDVLVSGSPYWINVDADCTIDGTALYAGWNLIVW